MEMITEEMIEEREYKAEVEAAADITAEMAEPVMDVNKKLSYTVKLTGDYQLDGKEIREVDLSGLADLTTADA